MKILAAILPIVFFVACGQVEKSNSQSQSENFSEAAPESLTQLDCNGRINSEEWNANLQIMNDLSAVLKVDEVETKLTCQTDVPPLPGAPGMPDIRPALLFLCFDDSKSLEVGVANDTFSPLRLASVFKDDQSIGQLVCPIKF